MNQILESKIGKYFIIVYALFTIAVYAYVFFCEGNTCTPYIVLPIMPWAYIMVMDFHLVFPWALYPIFILLNTSVAYVLGATIEWVRNRYIDYQVEKGLTILKEKKSNYHKTQ